MPLLMKSEISPPKSKSPYFSLFVHVSSSGRLVYNIQQWPIVVSQANNFNRLSHTRGRDTACIHLRTRLRRFHWAAKRRLTRPNRRTSTTYRLLFRKFTYFSRRQWLSRNRRDATDRGLEFVYRNACEIRFLKIKNLLSNFTRTTPIKSTHRSIGFLLENLN